MKKAKPVTCIIFPKENFAITAIPKAACTSIYIACIESLGGSTENIDVPRHPLLLERKVHPKIATEMKLNRVIFLRNPFARIVSLWENKIKDKGDGGRGTTNLKKLGYNIGASFEEFIIQLPKRFMYDLHTLPQHVYLQGLEWEHTHIFALENISRDWAHVQELYPKMGSLKKSNISTKHAWDTYYTPELKEKVYQIYKKDFQIWREVYES